MADNAARAGRIVWYELMTSDVEAAKTFYTSVVGWTVKQSENSPMPYHEIQRPGGGWVGGIVATPPQVTAPPHWGMYLLVDNVEEAVSRVEAAGGKSLSPLIDIPKVGRFRTVTDPQGAAFTVFQAAEPMTGPDHVPEVGDVSWHELLTTDAEAAMQFYTTQFNWQKTETMDMGEMGTYHMFGRDFPLGGMMNKAAAMADVPPHWGFYFRVANLTEAIDRVNAGGAKVLNGPMEVPGGDTVVNCLDPLGAYFSLHQKK